MIQTPQTTEDTQGTNRRHRRILWPFYGILMGMMTYRALTLLPSPGLEIQRLGLVETLAVSPGVWRVGVALVVVALYTVLPPLGGAVALVSLWLPLAFLNVGLAGIYAVLALLALPCLGKREGALVLALIPLALAYPGFALLLPLVPVLAGLLCGRILGPYTAAVAALALVVLGLVAGQAAIGGVAIGGVAIGGDREPLMQSEDAMFIAEKVPLMPPMLSEDPDFVESFRETVQEGRTGDSLVWLYIMAQWWVPALAMGPTLVFIELGPRLLEGHLVGLVILWASAASAASWGMWAIARREATSRAIKTIYRAIIATALTASTATGHLLLDHIAQQ